MIAADPVRADETWADIPEIPGYQLSTLARIRSFWKRNYDRGDPSGRVALVVPRPVKLSQSDGYRLFRAVDRSGVSCIFKVHKLMLQVWVGPAPEGKPWALHKDDDKANNSLDNLYWGTPKQNSMDRSRNGHVWNAKLSQEDIGEAIRLHSEGWNVFQLARRYRVDHSSMTNLFRVRGISTRRRFAYSDGTIEEIKAMLARGVPRSTIASQFGSSYNTIYKAIVRYENRRRATA